MKRPTSMMMFVIQKVNDLIMVGIYL